MADADSQLPLDADRPSADDNDLYNRSAFVRRLAQAVAQRPSQEPFIIGIEGSWGEGKSTVLEYMARELSDQHPDVTMVRFNPWAYQGQDQMLVGLVRVISEQLEHPPKRKNIAPKVLEIVGTAAALVGNLTGNTLAVKAGEAGQQWAEALKKEPSFEKLKQQLETALKQSELKIVVLVDDLDRLDHEAIRSVFRLLKAIFDLPKFTYILAYDPDIVAAALESFFDAQGLTSGRRYLEKIVQLPLALPKLDPIDLEEDLRATFERAFDENLLIRDAPTQRAMGQLTKLLSSVIATPREIRRLGNTVRFALPILKGETNPVDVCRIEALRLLFPVEFEKVLRHPDLLTDEDVIKAIAARQYRKAMGHSLGLGDPLQPDSPSTLFHLFKDASKAAVSLLAQTFPAIRLEFELQDRERYQGEFPACDPAYIKRYLQYNIASDDIEDSKVRNVVLAAGNGQDVSAHFTAVQGGKRQTRFLEKIRRFGAPLSDDQQFQLIVQLTLFRYRLSNTDQTTQEFQDTAIDLLDHHASHNPPETRWQLLERVLKALPEWWMQANFFKAASSLFGKYQRAREASLTTAREWMADVLLDHQANLFDHPWVNPVSALLVIAEHRGRETTEPLLLAYLRSAPQRKREWLLTLAKQTQGEHGAVPSAFSLDQYLHLNRIIDVNRLLQEVHVDMPPEQEGRTDDVVAWVMFRRLQDLHPDGQELLHRSPGLDK